MTQNTHTPATLRTTYTHYNAEMPQKTMDTVLLDAIDARRQELNWTWSEVARRAGIRRQQVDRLRSHSGVTQINNMERIMKAVGLTIVVVGVPGFNPDVMPEMGREDEN